MERREGYPNLDLKQSGNLLRYQIRKSGYSVRDIQNYLVLSCPQPVYRWFQGKTLPSVDHLYALSTFWACIWKIFWPDLRKIRFTGKLLERSGICFPIWSSCALDYLSNDESEHLFYPLVITEMEMTGGFFLWIKDE